MANEDNQCDTVYCFCEKSAFSKQVILLDPIRKPKLNKK